MAEGANKDFIELRERFLEKNVVLSPNIQSYIATKAMGAKIPLSRVEMVGVYDFDLRNDPAMDIRDRKGAALLAHQPREQMKLFRPNDPQPGSRNGGKSYSRSCGDFMA